MPHLFTDHMVLQQKAKVSIWGWAAAGQKVLIKGSWGKQCSAVTNAAGKWIAKLATTTAGGPFTISIQTINSHIDINDVLIGEVWLASGQSNMDIPLKGWPPGDTIFNSALEISKADYPKIRLYKVPFGISTTPLDSTGGKWNISSPQTAGDFSATAYFYARALYKKLGVPVGIVQSSIGGTPAEAWTSEGYLSKIKDFNQVLADQKTTQDQIDAWFKKRTSQELPRTEEQWKDISFADITAADNEFGDSRWATIKLPGRFDQISSDELDGVIWLRKDFVIQDAMADHNLKIGSINDMESIYINGKYIGGLKGRGFKNTSHETAIPKGLLLSGTNNIAIRVINTRGQGLINGPITIVGKNDETISIEGDWRSRIVAEIADGKIYTYGLQTEIAERPASSRLNSNSPTSLFNAMINPLIPFTFKGIVWYQGESNVGRAEQYKRLFPNLIRDWRNKWREELPFYYVQLAPYIYTAKDQHEQGQLLRDAQRYALTLPKTGMVSLLDIGYLKTAHPPHKQEVGDRLARFAFKNEYGEKDLVASGPIYKKTTVAGNELTIAFESIGSGLIAAPSGMDNFEIAGADKIYVKADAKIVNNKVVVSNPAVVKPVNVRYAWSNSSGATLFNKQGLPAATFTSEK
ncbi:MULTISPECIES: sialate O-acetylesterase [unclassified Mucilaginibacter]|uniref:sialate O-acetylesterase n=1 Tax=unclassified Mucilaginibacter TaxID=2617802 RepID=UPI003395DD85